MRCQQSGALGGVDAVGLGVEEGGHRRLGVDDQALVAGEADQHVGAHPAVVTAHRADLLVEVAARQHACVLQDAAELDLAPVAPDGGGVEGADQRGGLGAQRVRGGRDIGQPDADLGVLLDAVAFQRPDLAFDAHQSVAQGRQHGGGLGVVADRGLEVDHPLAQQVTLGGQGRRASG